MEVPLLIHIPLSKGILLRKQLLLSPSQRSLALPLKENKTQCNIPSSFSSIILDSESSDEDEGFTDALTLHITATDY